MIILYLAQKYIALTRSHKDIDMLKTERLSIVILKSEYLDEVCQKYILSKILKV